MNRFPSCAALRIAVQFYRYLLWTYPRSFRRHYGESMVQVFRDCARDALATGGLSGLFGWCSRALLDLAVTALHQRMIGVASTLRRQRLPLLSALALGTVTGYVNVHNAEVQAPLLCLLISGFVLGMWAPRLALWWTLLIGGTVPISQTLALVFRLHLPYANDARHVLLSLPVLIPTAIGVACGAAAGMCLRAARHVPAREGEEDAAP